MTQIPSLKNEIVSKMNLSDNAVILEQLSPSIKKHRRQVFEEKIKQNIHEKYGKLD